MRIIWAVDAFEDNRELNQKMATFISLMHSATQADVEPLYLLRENELAIPTYEVPNWAADHSRTAESLFREVLADYNVPFLLEAKVIPHTSQSHAAAAEVLSLYAKNSKADLIVVGSHSRQGLQRFFLGSFAESLLQQSEIPVVVIGGAVSQKGSTKTILYPTDFGQHAKENYRHILNLAKKLQAEVHILHVIERPIESLFEIDTRPRVYNYRGRYLTLEQIVEMEIENQSHRAQNWVQWAQKEGVIGNFFIDSSFKALDEIVLQAAQRHDADLIVMEAQSGPMSSALLGSFTRNVARRASCPVYVIPRHFYDKTEAGLREAPSP